jgi:hypothetical protein
MTYSQGYVCGESIPPITIHDEGYMLREGKEGEGTSQQGAEVRV